MNEILALSKAQQGFAQMAGHVFHEIYLHINWHTKLDQPLLTPRIEPLVHNFLRDRCHKTKGVFFHEIGGTQDHVHLAINIEPSVCISDLIGDLKGACSHEINHQFRDKLLQWQRGFGVVSFGKKQLSWVRSYIRSQKQHHASGRIYRRLEQVGFDDDGTPISA